jgi:hypothetical protein
VPYAKTRRLARTGSPEFSGGEDGVSNTNTHAARTRTGAHEAVSRSRRTSGSQFSEHLGPIDAVSCPA